MKKTKRVRPQVPKNPKYLVPPKPVRGGHGKRIRKMGGSHGGQQKRKKKKNTTKRLGKSKARLCFDSKITKTLPILPGMDKRGNFPLSFASKRRRQKSNKGKKGEKTKRLQIALVGYQGLKWYSLTFLKQRGAWKQGKKRRTPLTTLIPNISKKKEKKPWGRHKQEGGTQTCREIKQFS